MSDEPALPPEIEETIFSLALLTDWTSAKSLILVAKRVYEWLVPQVYKVRVYHIYKVQKGRPLSDSRNLIYHGKYVRHLLLYNRDSAETHLHQSPGECLALCPNAFEVALWISRDAFDEMLISQLLGMHITHLSFNPGSFEDALNRYQISTTPISFPRVTHLELIGIEDDVKTQTLKTRFPILTHLAFNSMMGDRMVITLSALKTFGDQLKVLVWFEGDPTYPIPAVVPKEKLLYVTPDDSRVVVLSYGYVRTWYDGATGGMGLWRVAEVALAAQQRGNEASPQAYALT